MEGEIFPVIGAAELQKWAETYNKVFKENEETQRLIRRQAEHDAMTDALNRRSFEKLLHMYENGDTPYALILIDVDTFKTVNDMYGHAVGDEILKKVTGLLKKAFRSIDHVCRIGGDEFAVIITENPNQVEELIHSFDSNVANWHGKFVDSMTVSYGWVFSTERNWGSAYEISKAADARMYQSKERYYKESGADRR